MAKFQFRLATLLKLREATRDERRSELAQAFQADDILKDHLKNIGSETQSLKNQCREASRPGTLNLDILIESQRYELLLKSQEMQILKQREQLAGEIERRRQALILADREVRVLEKLQERQIERHHEEELRKDQKRLDEIAQMRAQSKILT